MYKKLLKLQESIKVNKGNYNSFADFKFRSVADILFEIKPKLVELNLLLQFADRRIDDDKLSIAIKLYDLDDDSTIDIHGEILIDKTKPKMDMSQRVNSAGTFLKKAMLEDLLLLTEESDPDSHDNRNNVPSTINNSSSSNNNNYTVTDKQIKRLYAIAKNVSVSHDDIKVWIKKKFNLDHINELNKSQYDEICKALEKKKVDHDRLENFDHLNNTDNADLIDGYESDNDIDLIDKDITDGLYGSEDGNDIDWGI